MFVFELPTLSLSQSSPKSVTTNDSGLLDPVSSVSDVELPCNQESDSGLLPQEAPIMIAEKRRLLFSFSFRSQSMQHGR